MAKKKLLYSLDFINEGENFSLPNWTVEKHENTLEELITENADATDKERDRLYRYYVILQSLREIDDRVTISDIKKMHVDDLIALFEAVYNEGKKGIIATNFRKGKSPNKKKSSTEMN